MPGILLHCFLALRAWCIRGQRGSELNCECHPAGTQCCNTATCTRDSGILCRWLPAKQPDRGSSKPRNINIYLSSRCLRCSLFAVLGCWIFDRSFPFFSFFFFPCEFPAKILMDFSCSIIIPLDWSLNIYVKFKGSGIEALLTLLKIWE